MANLFEIALINPIRFVQVVSPNARYQNLPFDLIQPTPCYFQKFQSDDVTHIQVLSDFASSVLKIYDLYSNALLKIINPTIPDLDIQNQTFKAYEFEVAFTDLAGLDCYAEITHTDQNTVVQVWQSAPINVAVNQANTLLLEYKNSENNFSTVFDTGISFSMRVEGTIQDFKPEFNDVIYNDQQQNSTKLNSVPYRSFTLFIGNASGIPDWMADKVNRAFSCDEFQVDGTYYEKVSGEKWNTNREVEYEFVGMNILVAPVDNIFLDRLKTGNTEPPGDYLPVQKELNKFNQAANLPIANVFKKYSLLEKIVIYRTGAPFVLKIGITNGGTEIGSFSIDELITTVLINYAFGDPETVYLTGLTGTNNDFCIIYKQLDVLPITIGSPNPYSSLGKGAVVVYEAPTGQALDVDINLATGLGNVDTEWFGWAICDGRNGTTDYGLLVPIGYQDSATFADLGNPPGSSSPTDEITLGDIFGENRHQLTVAELAAHTHTTEVLFDNGLPDSSTHPITAFTTKRKLKSLGINSTGGDTPHNNIQKSIYVLYVKKIA